MVLDVNQLNNLRIIMKHVDDYGNLKVLCHGLSKHHLPSKEPLSNWPKPKWEVLVIGRIKFRKNMRSLRFHDIIGLHWHMADTWKVILDLGLT